MEALEQAEKAVTVKVDSAVKSVRVIMLNVVTKHFIL